MLSLPESGGHPLHSTRRLIGWSAFIFAAALIIYAKKAFPVAWDLTEYLATAKRLALESSYLDATGHPSFSRVAFTTYLALIIKLFGPSLTAVAWSVYLVAACYPVLVLLAGTRLYRLEVGLIASCTFLVSPSLILWVPRHIDPVWPLLLLGSLLLLLSTQGKDWLLALLAALLFALACLTKFIAVLFLACPILLYLLCCLPGGRVRVAWFTVFAMGFLFFSCAWFYALAGVNGVSGFLDAPLTLSTLKRAASSDFNLALYPEVGAADEPKISLLNAVRLIPQLLAGLAEYFFGSDGVWKNVPLAPVFFICLAVAAWRCWSQRRAADITVFAVIIAFLPFAAVCGLFHWRYSQNLILITMLYLAVAATISSFILFVCGNKARIGYLIFLVLVLGYGAAKNLSNSAITAALLHLELVQPELVADDVLSQIKQIIAPGITIASNDDEILSGIFWRKGNTMHLVRLPNDTTSEAGVRFNSAPDLLIISKAAANGANWARFATRNGFTRVDIAFRGSRGLEAFQPTVKTPQIDDKKTIVGQRREARADTIAPLDPARDEGGLIRAHAANFLRRDSHVKRASYARRLIPNSVEGGIYLFARELYIPAR
jgi:hypothetical protein